MGAEARIHSAEDARRLARRRLPWMVFDYIDGAAGLETGVAQNRAALDAMRLRTRVLVDVSRRDLTKGVFGKTAKAPFGIAPMGLCNLAWPGADLMLAKLAARENVPLGVSTMSSTSLERIQEVAEGNAWFQLYLSGDGSGADRLMDRAKAADYDVLILTVDVPEVGRRPRELRHGFKMPFKIGPRQFLDFALHPEWSLSTLRAGKPEFENFREPGFAFDRTETRARFDWSDLTRIRDRWPGKLVLKGVLDAEDVLSAQAAGVDAVQVSSHGGRQLDSGALPVHALAAIRAVVGDGFPVFYDSGVRSGDDVVKLGAQGADFVFLGRPFLFAMAAAGAEGLDALWEALVAETSITLAQIGNPVFADLRAANPILPA